MAVKQRLVNLVAGAELAQLADLRWRLAAQEMQIQDLERQRDGWRELAAAQTAAKQDLAQIARDIAANDIAVWRRRAENLARFLRAIGYRIQEIEDPATGDVEFHANLVQPARRGLPLGPALN